MVNTEERSLEYNQIGSLTNLLKQKSSAIAFGFAQFFNFFNDHFLLFVIATASAKHNTATEVDVLKKIDGVLKYARGKISAGVVRKLPITMNENFNACEYGPTTYFFNVSKMLKLFFETWYPLP